VKAENNVGNDWQSDGERLMKYLGVAAAGMAAEEIGGHLAKAWAQSRREKPAWRQ